jgi:VIT1/CCC1 family predicted Fe2+/Mn2+ transporter
MNDPVLEALWKNVLDRWDDDRAHGAFLDHCQQADQLVEAAVRYRGMTGDRQRGSSAQKRLSAVGLLAVAKLEGTRTTEREARSHAGSLVLVVFFLAATLGLVAYLYLVP